MRIIAILSLTLAFVCAPWSSAATVILQPVAVSSDAPAEVLPMFGLTHLIDQSGLDAGYTSGVTLFDPFVASTLASNFDFGANAIGGVATAPPFDIDFDLGAPFVIDGAALWNQQGSASLRGFELIASSTSDFSLPISLGSFDLAAPSGQPIAAGVFSFAPTEARYVRLSALSNNGFSGATRFIEVGFRQATSVVPEPGTIALLAPGLLAFAGGARRRRS